MDSQKLESEGWAKLSPGGFSGMVGPFWKKVDNDKLEVGLIAEDRHCNNHISTVHGGVLLAFSDVSLGLGVVEALGSPSCVTTQIQLQFIATAKVGELIVCTPEVIRKSKELVFMRGLLRTADNKIVASADGIWKIIERK